MCAPSAPPPPDPVATAQSQTATNVDTAVANNVMQMTDQVTPWYTVSHQQTGTHYMPNSLQTGASTNYAPPPSYSTPTTGGGSHAASKSTDALTGGTDIPNLNPFATGSSPEQGNSMGSLQQSIYAMQQPTATGPAYYEIPTYTQTVTLPKDQQEALNAQFATNNVLSNTALDQAQFLQGYLGDQIDVSGLPELQSGVGPLRQISEINAGEIQRGLGSVPGVSYGFADTGRGPMTYGGDYSENVKRVEDALMERMNPYIQQDRAALETRLANQGITPGSEAYNRAISDIERQTNDARMGAILSASQEQSRLAGLDRDQAAFESAAQNQWFNQNLARGQFYNNAQGQNFGQNLAGAQFANSAQAQEFGQNAQRAAMYNAANQAMFNADMANANMSNSARSQGIQEQFALRNQPINEIVALMSGSQVQNPGISTPSFAPMPTTDYAGIVANNYNQQMQNYNAEMANYNSMMGGLFGLGSSAIGLF